MRNVSDFLDAIRFLSTEVVVISHILFYLGHDFRWLGTSAVFVFFVLSGFVIAHSTFRKKQAGNYGFLQYFFDRFSRIYSVLVPSLLLIALLNFFNGFSLYSFLGNLFLLQGFPYLEVPLYFDGVVLWTLGCEWWLYILFGCLFFKNKQKNESKILLIVLFASIIPFLYSFYPDYWLPFAWLGAVLFFSIGFNAKYLLIALFASATPLLYLLYNNYWLPLAWGLGAALFFYIGSQTTLTRINSIVNRLAGYSYSLYLLHYSLLGFWFKIVGLNLINAIIGFVLVNAFCFGFGIVFEKQLFRALRKWLYSFN